jgi:hypothetical protein
MATNLQQRRQLPENKPSNLLSKEENDIIFALLGKKCNVSLILLIIILLFLLLFCFNNYLYYIFRLYRQQWFSYYWQKARITRNGRSDALELSVLLKTIPNDLILYESSILTYLSIYNFWFFFNFLFWGLISSNSNQLIKNHSKMSPIFVNLCNF